MDDGLDAMKAQLGRLPSRDRAALAHFLIDSLGDVPDEGVEDAWEVELARRVEEIRSGRVAGKPADQVFAELRERYP